MINTDQVTSVEILDCGHAESPHSDHTRGYSTDSNGKRSCYNCSAEIQRQFMRDDGRATLYLTKNLNFDPARLSSPYAPTHYIGDWPGGIKLPVWHVKKGRHNITRVRYDFRFRFEGTEWHGVQYGDNTQLAHCKRLMANHD